MPGKVSITAAGPVVFSHAGNNSFIAANRLVKAGRDVRWLQHGQGEFVVIGAATDELQKIATELGVSFSSAPASIALAGAVKLKTPRIAIADQYGGSMPSGWTRFILEQFEFPFDVVYPKVVDAGNLASKYDVIVFPSGVGPAAPAEGGRGGRGGGGGGGRGGGGRGGGAAAASDVPAEYQPMVGSYTAAQSVPALKQFVEAGGTIIGVGRSAPNLASIFDLPVSNHLVERGPDGASRPVPSERFYVPGSVLTAAVDTTLPAAHGVTNPVDVFYDNSPLFRLDPEAALKGVRPIAWFATATPLRSGWAYGQSYLEGGILGIEAPVGRGRLLLYTPEITFRGQPHGTFKFLFNGIYLAGQPPAARVGTGDAAR
jgi:hypothetical protein